MTVATTAYDKIAALRLAEAQAEQRRMRPRKIGQKILHEWCRSHGTVLDPSMAADLVLAIEGAIIAERAPDAECENEK